MSLRAIARTLQGELDWFAYRAARTARAKVGPVLRRLKAPDLPVRADGRVLIHLGCGDIAAPGFINVDGSPAPHVHVVTDVRTLDMFGTATADLVYACHVLEHFSQRDHARVLWEWRRVLKPGGVLRLSVPDFDRHLAIYEACDRDVSSICGPLLGRDEGYNAHCWLFNERYLRDVLLETGFTAVRSWEPSIAGDHEFDDWASRTILRAGRQWPISLNIEGVK